MRAFCVQVYQIIGDYAKYQEYRNVLEEWRISRDAREAEQVPVLVIAEYLRAANI